MSGKTNAELAREHVAKAEELLARQDKVPMRRGIDANESAAHSSLAVYYTLLGDAS